MSFSKETKNDSIYKSLHFDAPAMRVRILGVDGTGARMAGGKAGLLFLVDIERIIGLDYKIRVKTMGGSKNGDKYWVIVTCQNISEGPMVYVIWEKWFEYQDLVSTLKKLPQSMGQLFIYWKS